MPKGIRVSDSQEVQATCLQVGLTSQQEEQYQKEGYPFEVVKVELPTAWQQIL